MATQSSSLVAILNKTSLNRLGPTWPVLGHSLKLPNRIEDAKNYAIKRYIFKQLGLYNRGKNWSVQRESNPHHQLGRLR
ncbi:hypothetical protein AB6E04_08920, partial [Vibrio amylolyticus]|uniref:hypothetical protein n=1 Tax=Vibrio amylolyticus TaxID=2847292 RepID=UPI00354D19E1